MKKAALVGIGLVVGLFLAALPSMCTSHREPPRPRIAGQQVDDAQVQIDFGRLVDVYLKPYSGSEDEPRVFERCRIIGVIGEDTPERDSSSWKSYRSFEGWLCVEFEDGRRAYTPKSDVEYFVDSDPQPVTRAEETATEAADENE